MTGVGGFDMFGEIIEGKTGYKRYYLGKKIPGFLSTIRDFKQSASGRWYRSLPVEPRKEARQKNPILTEEERKQYKDIIEIDKSIIEAAVKKFFG